MSGKTVRTFVIVHCIVGVSAVERCSLSGVPLYSNGCRVTTKLCLLCEKGKTSFIFGDSTCTWLHPLNWKLHPSTQVPVPPSKQAPPLSPKNNVQRQQSKRKDHRPRKFGINDKDCVSRRSGWHYHKPDSWSQSVCTVWVSASTMGYVFTCPCQ